jgi:glycerol-3-phosphate dehydrogenase
VKNPTRKDILSVCRGSGRWPKPEDEKKATKEISRSHKILISVSGLITFHRRNMDNLPENGRRRH